MQTSVIQLIKNFLGPLSLLPLLFGQTASADHGTDVMHWARTSNPFTLQVVDSTSTDWFVELDAALTEWSQSTVLGAVITDTESNRRKRQRCELVQGKIRVCNYTYGTGTGWLGLATVGVDANGHIDMGVAMLNDSFPEEWQQPGLKNHVMCHEVGHLWGLGHTSEDGSSQQSCMDYSTDLNSQWPNAHDYESLETIYAQLNSYNSYLPVDSTGDSTDTSDGSTTDGTGTGGTGDTTDDGASVCNSPPGKGCNKGSGKGFHIDGPPKGALIYKGRKEEVWAANRPDGGIWIHHVRLAPEKRPKGRDSR